ncbi:unnamed protein product [Phytophthora fragariaefolia]|uniref:Unnamed protein product n=1 Tax=Phytophthora fragariaefolia TaxID=1490495 RepID=A0A9W6XNR8_9STRA|nr:unnamed protein product [Phytophthora fragariaefolia]
MDPTMDRDRGLAHCVLWGGVLERTSMNATGAGSDAVARQRLSLQDAIATRDDAIRGQEEVAALLLQQTQDLHAAEQYLAAYFVELGRLRAEVSNLRDPRSRASTGAHDSRAGSSSSEQDHLEAEVDLAGAEILDLQTEYADVERDLEDSEEQRRILEGSLYRVQAALRRAETERPLVQDPVARHQSSNHLAQERDQALASAAEAEVRVAQIRSEVESRQQGHVTTVSELSRLRAVPNATLVDLDWEIAARASSDRAAEVARMELSDLQGSLQSSEETVDALGQRVREIQDQRQAAEQDREDLRLRYEAACRERDAARRQLSIVASVVGAPPRTRPEKEDPAALLRLLREEPADTSEHPTPRYLTYEDPPEIPPKNVDPHNLPDPVTSAAP